MLSARLAILRTLIFSCIVCLATEWQNSSHNVAVGHTVFSALLLVHRVVGVIDIPSFKLLFELCLTLGEIGVWSYLNYLLFRHPEIPPWSSQGFVVHVVALWLQGTLLICLFIMTLAASQVNCYARSTPSRDLWLPDNERPPNATATPPNFLIILLGRSLFTHTRESLKVQILRGFSAAGLIYLFLCICLYVIVVQPIHESGLVPVREYRTDNVLTDNPGMETPVRSVIAIMNIDSPKAKNLSEFQEAVKEAIKVTPLWNDDITEKPNCIEWSDAKTFQDGGPNVNVPSIPRIQTIKTICPTRYAAQNKTLNAIQTLMAPSAMTFPDLLITVDFSKLGVDATNSLADARLRTVSIIVGLTNSTADALSNALPIPMYPNSYLLGAASLSLRRRFKHPRLATVASFLSSQWTSFVCNVNTVVPDPSPLIPRDNNTGTLRIYGQDDNSQWHVFGDYRGKDVVVGFGASGGFWTGIDGLFTLFFGTSLLCVVTGTNPLSIFGLVHNLDSTLKDRLGQAFVNNNAGGAGGVLRVEEFVNDYILEVKPMDVTPRIPVS